MPAWQQLSDQQMQVNLKLIGQWVNHIATNQPKSGPDLTALAEYTAKLTAGVYKQLVSDAQSAKAVREDRIG